MRDGIYKPLPLSRDWQGALRSCTLSAERGEIARQRMERAVALELKRGVRPQFISMLRRTAAQSETMLTGITVFGSQSRARAFSGCNSPIENEILARASELEAAGVRGADLVRRATLRATEDYLIAITRLMEQTIFASGVDAEGKATIIAAKQASQDADIARIVDTFVKGDRFELPPVRRPIDPDEDLS